MRGRMSSLTKLACLSVLVLSGVAKADNNPSNRVSVAWTMGSLGRESNSFIGVAWYAWPAGGVSTQRVFFPMSELKPVVMDNESCYGAVISNVSLVPPTLLRACPVFLFTNYCNTGVPGYYEEDSHQVLVWAEHYRSPLRLRITFKSEQ